MSKTQKNMLNVLALVLFNILFFVGNIYPKHILEFQSLLSIVSTLLNLVFTVVFDYFLILAFNKNKTLFSDKIWDNADVKKLPLLIIIHLVFDGLLVSANLLNLQWESIFADISVILQWVLIYSIITRKSDGIWKSRSASIFTIVAFILITICSILCNISIFAEYTDVLAKYKPESPILITAKTNADFLFGFKLFITDTVIGAILIIAHTCTRAKESEHKTKHSVLAIRVTVLFFALLIIAPLKIHFWPYQALVSIDTSDSKNENFEYLGPFNVDTESTKIYRFSNAKALCYSNYNIRLFKGTNETLLTDIYVRPYTYNFRSENGEIIPEYAQFAQFNVGNGKAYLYDSQLICFYEGEIPHSLKLRELNDFEQNDTVIEICRQTLNSGNIYIFEYCVKYLSKYDIDFIDEYIKRYSNGDFSEIEKEWMNKNHYREEYVTALAKSYEQ